MYYRINEVSTETSTGGLYAHVDFWRRKADWALGHSAFLTNDFVMSIRDDGRNLRRAILENIESYWGRAITNGSSGDHTGDASKQFFLRGRRVAQTDVTLMRDRSDPHGVLAKPAVAGLEGSEHGR